VLGQKEVLIRMNPILYVYPQFHTVSFTIIARKHIEYIKRQKLAKVQEIDEIAFPGFYSSIKYNVVIHPYIFIWSKVIRHYQDAVSEQFKHKVPEYIENFRSKFDQIIAVDVCDSDQMSNYAIELLSQANKVVVPSNYCVNVYKNSGLTKPIYRIPHGIDPEWYMIPNVWETAPTRTINPSLLELYLYKNKKNKRFLLFWLWHSDERKGWPEAMALYERLTKERNDVILVLKTMSPASAAFQQVIHLGAVQVHGWLSEYEKMVLYDLADMTLMFTRGGGFEVNALESLARGVPVITSDKGSWTDYVPPFLQVKTGKRVKVFEGNGIHVGYGYKVDVEDALNKVHDILENYDNYKARVEEWRQKVLVNEYRWNVIAKRLAEVING